MSNIKISLSLMLLISLKINASENPWDLSGNLSETVKLEDAYVSASANLFKRSNISELIDREYCTPIVEYTQKEYTKKDGKISEITTAEILTAVTTVRKNKKAVLNELTDSYSNIRKISKKKLARFESELRTKKDGNEFLAEKLSEMYEHAFAAGKLEASSQIHWKAKFTPITQAAAKKAAAQTAAKEIAKNTQSTGYFTWLLGKK